MEEEDSSICSPNSATAANWTTLMGYNDSTLSGNPERWEEEEAWKNLTSDSGSNSTSMPSNLSIDISTSHSRMPAAVMIPTGIMLYVLSLLTFVGNAMVLHAIRTDKRLQTVSNMFIMSLAIADLTVGAIVMPISAAYAITGDWKFGRYVCLFWLSIDYTASTASIFNLSILSLDRYWSITSPLRYLRRRTKKRALIMILTAWIGASMWFIPVLGWNQITRKGPSQLPGNVCETEFATNMTFKVVTSILNFYIPTVIITCLYVRIFIAIKQRSKDIVRFGAYTASGVTSTKAKKTEKNTASAKKGGQEEDQEKLEKKPSEEISSHSQRGGEGGQVEMNKNEKKIEFHRLAVVAFPMEQHKCQKPAAATKAISRHADTNNRIYQRNLARPKVENQSNGKPASNLSCEALSVFDGVTVKVQYIGDEDHLLPAASNNGTANGVIKSSQQLLLGLEERKKAAAEVTTVPLRQALSANYKNTAVTTVKNHSFIERPQHNHHNHRNNHHHHNHFHRSSERHFGHIHCYRSKRICQPSNNASMLSRASNDSRNSKASKNSMQTSPLNHGAVGGSNAKKNGENGAGGGGAGDEGLRNSLALSGAKKANPNAVLAKEKKAATQLGVIVGAFIICFLPYFTLFMVVAYCGNDQCVDSRVFTITVWFGYFNSTLNPILYPLCNANFKTAFKRMLRMEVTEIPKNYENGVLGRNGTVGPTQHNTVHHNNLVPKNSAIVRRRM